MIHFVAVLQSVLWTTNYSAIAFRTIPVLLKVFMPGSLKSFLQKFSSTLSTEFSNESSMLKLSFCTITRSPSILNLFLIYFKSHPPSIFSFSIPIFSLYLVLLQKLIWIFFMGSPSVYTLPNWLLFITEWWNVPLNLSFDWMSLIDSHASLFTVFWRVACMMRATLVGEPSAT